MKKFNKDIGNLSEQLAINYLKENGHYIMDSNFKTHFGEVDIISKKNNLIIITEVKGRFNLNYGSPSEAVTFNKQHTIIKVAMSYIHMHNFYDYNLRFDVIEVFLNPSTNSYNINHIKDAFRVNWRI